VTPPHFILWPQEMEGAAPGALLGLPEAASLHALRSLRLRAGEELTVADGLGTWCRGTLVREELGRAVVEITEVTRLTRPQRDLTVALAPPKGDRLGWAVQKLAEIGADSLFLIPTERTVRWPHDGPGGHLIRRMGTVAREAAQQSRRPFVMGTGTLPNLDAALHTTGRRTVVLSETAAEPLSTLLRRPPGPGEAVTLVVGPEGGFTERELEHADAAGATLASLGSGILRTETAAIVGAALVLVWHGRLG
jgi:16S rRNA (uracil1498-N3)-methyltransferase